MFFYKQRSMLHSNCANWNHLCFLIQILKSQIRKSIYIIYYSNILINFSSSKGVEITGKILQIFRSLEEQLNTAEMINKILEIQSLPYQHTLNLIPILVRDYVHYKVLGVINDTFSNFSGATVEVRDEYVSSSHKLLNMFLLIHAGIEINLYNIVVSHVSCCSYTWLDSRVSVLQSTHAQ